MIAKMKTSIWGSKDKGEKIFPEYSQKTRKDNKIIQPNQKVLNLNNWLFRGRGTTEKKDGEKLVKHNSKESPKTDEYDFLDSKD